MSENIYYIYAYLNPCTNIPFYIGKGSNGRAWKHLCDSKNIKKQSSYLYFYRKINKIRSEQNRDPIVVILFYGLEMEKAYSLEEEIILQYGRKHIDENGILCNRSLGGKGNRGVKYSIESRQKISKSLRGKKMSPERIEWNRIKGLKENLSNETLKKLSAASAGINNPAALKCILKNPDGQIIETCLILTFCEKEKLSYYALQKSFVEKTPFFPKRIYKNTPPEIKNTIGWQLCEKTPMKFFIRV